MSKENEDIKKDAPLDQSIGSSFIYQNKYNTISKKSQDRIDELIKIYTTQTINDFQKSLFPYEESELVSHSRIYGIYDVFDRHLAFSDSQAQAAFEHLIKFYRYFDLNKEHNKYLLNVTQYSDLLLYAVDFTFKSYCVSGVEWFPKDGNLNRSFYRGLANKVIENFNIMVGTLTAPLDQGGLNRFSRWPMLKELSPIQAAQIVFTCEIIRTVCTLENLHSPVANGIVAYYCRSGKNYGIYEKLGRGQVDTWAEWLSGAVKKNWKMEFYEKLIDLASRDENRIIENKNPDLVFMNNCIINVRSKERLPFSPDYVSLRKHAVMALDSLPDMPIWKLKNGKVLTAEDYIRGFVTYEGGRETLIKVIGAVLRAKFNWRHMITLHNVTGNNGKSTFLGTLKAMVGSDGTMSSSIDKLAGEGDGGRFALENLPGKSLVTCEDSESSAYIRNNSRLKSLISHDPVSIEAKGKPMYDYEPQCIIVCAANDLPKTKDKGLAWINRNIFVPFTGEFRDEDDDKSVRDEFAKSRELCEYLAYLALFEMDYYEEIPETEESLKLKAEFIEDNDPVVEFYNECIENSLHDFIPVSMLWLAYQEWLSQSRPNTKLPSKRGFLKSFDGVILRENKWFKPSSPMRFDNWGVLGEDRMRGGIGRYFMWFGENQIYTTMFGITRGVVKTKLYDYCQKHGTNPKELKEQGKYKQVCEDLGLSYIQD